MEKLVLFLAAIGVSIFVVGSIVGVMILHSKGFFSSTKEAVNIREEFYSNNPNPVRELSTEEAVQEFDKYYIEYLMYDLNINELHNPLFSSDTPKIEANVNDEVFSIEVLQGEVLLRHGPIEGKDITIKTSKLEIVKMLRDKGYIYDSFNEGKSQIEIKEDKLELYSKGYVELYERISGQRAEF